MNTTFKQTQLLPTFLPGMVLVQDDSKTPSRKGDATKARTPETGQDESHPRAITGFEPALFAFLGAGAVFGAGTTALLLFQVDPAWAELRAWVARLLG